MLKAHLTRDNRLRAAGFCLLSHLRSNRRFWCVLGGFLPLDSEEADALVDMVCDHGYEYAGETGVWKTPFGERCLFIDAIAEIQRHYRRLVRMQQAGV